MTQRHHRFPPPIIQHAIWLYLRFTLSYRDVEDLLAERGLDRSYQHRVCRARCEKMRNARWRIYEKPLRLQYRTLAAYAGGWSH